MIIEYESGPPVKNPLRHLCVFVAISCFVSPNPQPSTGASPSHLTKVASLHYDNTAAEYAAMERRTTFRRFPVIFDMAVGIEKALPPNMTNYDQIGPKTFLMRWTCHAVNPN
jgi:hypothetical protein